MRASSKLLTPFSVTGISLLFAVGSMVCPARAQESPDSSGGSFAPSSAAAPPATLNTSPQLPEVSGGFEALLQARQALARGDLDVARSMLETARHLPLDTTRTDDTPEKVAAMIARHAELAQMRETGDSHQYNHGAVMFLLEQADRLVDYRDFATVEMLVNQSRGFGVAFKPGDLNPDHVLSRMNQIRSLATSQPNPATGDRELAARYLSQAQLAFDQNRLEEASRLIGQVRSLGVADDAFDEMTISPWDLELKIRDAIQRRDSVASNLNPAGGVVQQADYYPELDQTRNMQVGGETDATENTAAPQSRARQMYDNGISCLGEDDLKGALEYFRLAWQYRDQLAPQIRQDLQTKISHLQVSAVNQDTTPAEEITGIDDDLRQRLYNDVIRQRAIAEKMVGQRNPRGALNHMRMTRDKIEQSDLDQSAKQQLISVVEREIAEMERFVEQNIAEIETDEMNQSNLQAVEMDRRHREDMERKIQQLVNQFNELIDERRWAEANVLAQQAWELDPQNEAVVLMVEKARLMGNAMTLEENKRNTERLREEFWTEEAQVSDFTVRPGAPIHFDPQTWEELAIRERTGRGLGEYTSESVRLIWSALKDQTVQIQYNQTPLHEAIDILAERANVNMIFDTRALELEGVSIDQPVSHNISHPISVESALNIVLGGTGLVFKVEDEVVKITNRAALQANPREKTYYVGDLVMPVPDFGGNALNMQFMSPNNPASQWSPGSGGFGQNAPGGAGATMPVNMVQQMPGGQFGFGNGQSMWSGAAPQSVSPQYSTWGPKDAGGGITAADFDELINLIQETIDPDSWEENGGTARMRAFPTTLSLIVTQTQENQDRIQDLLTRLRELNDVQIVVEVRFIRLRDDFFERIGVDFDLRINDSSGLTNQAQIPDAIQDIGGRITVGREPIDNAPVFTSDLDIPIRTSTFGATVPQFGIPDRTNVTSGLNFGFAILSDIEVYFLLQAAKGDERSNVTNAPTVTMFNGQSASVFDGSLVPFVTSITPVVGDFAAAQQPVITILPEGTQLNVRAVVSGDRRFVKMTLVPFFSRITEVDTFQFEGTRRVRRRTGSNLLDIIDGIGGGEVLDDLQSDELEIVDSGTTVQLPVFANTTITTTVSVPDGGTVLLGGVKSMSEGRTERGVPFLSNIPYVNRLFTNVGIGRETSSSMMMVTPRIIIQEEEEEFQVTTGR